MYGNPFPGLRAFTQDETSLFFGREGQSKELLKRLQKSRFVALVGVSGSGKSSLVRAGLLHDLNGGLMSAVESDWRVAVFRPGNNPIGNMAHALITQAALGSGETGLEDVEIAVAETTLRRGNLGLLELVRRAKTKRHKDGRPFLNENENILIVVDQFEEIFRIIEQHEQLIRLTQKSEGNSDLPGTTADDQIDHHPKEEASAFVKLLLEATSKDGPSKYDENVYIIVTMRSDYLGDTAQFGGMPERINEGQYLIPRMNRDDRRKAIVGPVAVAGGSIAEPLINQLLNDAGENPGHLPILQHALMRMWDLAGPASRSNGGLNLDHYEKIGKLTGALSQHADEAFDELSKEHQKLAAKVFKCLTEKGLANREIRRPMTIADICAVVDAKEEDVKTVVECFRKEGRWFLMPPPAKDKNTGEIKDDLGPGTLIDISHESLISNWKRLRQWVNEEAESARTYDRLANRAILKERGEEDFYRGPALQLALKWRHDNKPNAAWARRYHPEYDKAIAFLDNSLKDTRKRRLRNYGIVLFVLLIVSSAVGYAGWTQQQMLRHQSERIVVEERLKDDAIRERTKAVEREAEAIALRVETEKLRVEDQKKAVQLEESLGKQKELLEAANHARLTAIQQRDIAVSLQKENQEQASTYRRFKTAFDYVASREFEKALSTLQSALKYFEEKEKRAASSSEKIESKTNRISTIVNIGDVHRSKEDPLSDELAIQEYDRAIGMLGASDKELLAPTLMKAGSVWKESKDEDKALQAVGYYEKAAAAYAPFSKADSSRAWVEAGKIHLGFNDAIGFEKASADFTKAIQLLDGSNSELASTSAEIGESYMKLVATRSEPDTEDDEPQPRENARRDEKVQDQLRLEGAKAFRKASSAFKGENLKKAAEMEQKAGKILSESKSADLVNDSAEAFTASSALYGQAGDVQEQVSVLLDAGEALLENESEPVKAVARRLLAQAANVDQKNASQQAATLSRIGSMYGGLDPPEKDWALDYYQRAILLARQHNDKTAESAAIIAKARGIEEINDEDAETQLKELYQQAVRLYNDPAKQVENIVRFGKAVLGNSRNAARIARAEQFFQAALNLAQKQPDKKIAASAHLEIAMAYRTSSRPKSVENNQTALAIYEAEGDLYGQAMALYRLSALPLRQAEAAEYAERSLPLFEKVLPTLQGSDTQIELAEAYYAMGSLYRRKKDYQTSLNYYNRALAIFQEFPDQILRLNSTKSIIRTTQRLRGSP